MLHRLRVDTYPGGFDYPAYTCADCACGANVAMFQEDHYAPTRHSEIPRLFKMHLIAVGGGRK